MKHFINWLVKYFLPPILGGLLVVLILNILPDFPVYYCAFRTGIFVVLILFVLLVILLGFYGWHRERLKDFRKNFQVYEPVSKLEPSDFGIYTYYDFYLSRESDPQIEKSVQGKNLAFISGMPNIGKTRGAYQMAKKLEGWHLLKPPYERIDLQNLKFPFLFSRKRIVLFLDDLEKYVGKFNLDELINTLKKESKKLKVIATCRSGKEFEQVFGQKEMATLLSQCQRHKIEPRKLKEEEEEDLAKGIGKKLEEVVSDGTPGSIVLGLDQMKKRYMELEDEPRSILHILKLLREANIFIWTEELVKNIAKSRIFGLEGKSYEWDNWIKTLNENGFIEKSDGWIDISHDSYLDDRFIDFHISNEILIELKEELFILKDGENLFYLGSSFYYRKNIEESFDCLQKAVQIIPDAANAHNNLGILLKGLKRYPEAEKEYREALRVNPDDAEAHYNLGILLKDLKRYPEAEKEYREALRVNPDYAKPHYNLGNLLKDLKRYPEAEKEYREALRINPDDAEAYGNLGLLFIEMGRRDEAKEEMQKARDLFKKQGREEDVKKAEEILKELES